MRKCIDVRLVGGAGVNLTAFVEPWKRSQQTFEWKAEELRLKQIYSLTRGERGYSLANQERLLAGAVQ